MQVVYFFCDSTAVHIPLFDYDKRVFSLIASQRGGVWDRAKREFTFRRGTGGAAAEREQFRRVFSGMPTVWVETDAPPEICGFLNRAWQETAEELHEKTEQVRKGRLPAAGAGGRPPLPERFSPQWGAELDAVMRSRKFSEHTRGIYTYYNRQLCRLLQKTPEEITSGDITSFLAGMERTGDYSSSTMNLAFSAFKFFYKNVMKNDVTQYHYRPRQDKRLPVVFSKNEIRTMFALETNLKHRLLLMMVYASGLRVSEAVGLRRRDLDTDRMTVSVRAGKGRKDRETRMAENVLKALGEYYRFYGINGDATEWVFPSYDRAKHLTARTAQHIFEAALKRANIMKKASIHCLRHSFATHLLENGTDIAYIRDLLGHNSIKTTERYTHVAKRQALRIKSPLDSIDGPDD